MARIISLDSASKKSTGLGRDDNFDRADKPKNNADTILIKAWWFLASLRTLSYQKIEPLKVAREVSRLMRVKETWCWLARRVTY